MPYPTRPLRHRTIPHHCSDRLTQSVTGCNGPLQQDSDSLENVLSSRSEAIADVLCKAAYLLPVKHHCTELLELHIAIVIDVNALHELVHFLLLATVSSFVISEGLWQLGYSHNCICCLHKVHPAAHAADATVALVTLSPSANGFALEASNVNIKM